MGLEWVFLIRGDTGSYRFIGFIGWIVYYFWLDRIVSAGSGNTGFYALDVYWLYGKDGTDGIYGTLVGRGWYGPMLAVAETGAPPLSPKRERRHWLLRGGGLWEVVAGTNCIGASRAHSICVGVAK